MQLNKSYILNYKYRSVHDYEIDKRGVHISNLDGVTNGKTGLSINYYDDSSGYSTNIYGNSILCSDSN